MSKRWRQGMAAAREAEGSWSIKFARRNERGRLDRFRIHINATMPYRYDVEQNKSVRPTKAEFAAFQEEARQKTRARAKGLTEEADVVWVTVYPPFVGQVNHWKALSKGYFARVAPVSRWTRSKGWTVTEDKGEQSS